MSAPDDASWSCATCTAPTAPARPPCTRCAASASTVRPGELVAVMGPSGSGKSTLLNLAGGLDAPDRRRGAGRGPVARRAGPPRSWPRLRRRRIGYVFQDLNLLPSLTAAENVALPLELDGVGAPAGPRGWPWPRWPRWGWPTLGDRFPDEMSGGQQQRVAIARALVGERRLVLADEPTGALDSQTGEAVLRLLRRRVDAGAAGVLVTHEARHAAWADRVVFLRDGVIVDTTAPLAGAEQLLTGSAPVSAAAGRRGGAARGGSRCGSPGGRRGGPGAAPRWCWR